MYVDIHVIHVDITAIMCVYMYVSMCTYKHMNKNKTRMNIEKSIGIVIKLSEYFKGPIISILLSILIIVSISIPTANCKLHEGRENYQSFSTTE